MKRAVDRLAAGWAFVRALVEAAIIVLFLAMVASSMAQVIARYGFNAPLTWSEELSRYLFVWLSFLAAWLAWRRREHLGIGALADTLPPPAPMLLRLAVEAAVALFAAASMYYGQRILTVAASQPSAVLRAPMAWVYLGFYAGMTLIIIETLVTWARRLAGHPPDVDP